jgi:hypothetical protein
VRQLARLHRTTAAVRPLLHAFHFSQLYFWSIFELVLLNLSGTGDKPQLRLEGETLRIVVLVGCTLSGAGWKWGLYEHEVLLVVFTMGEYHLQSSLRAKNGNPIPSPSAIKHALLLRQPRFEPT